MTYVDVPLKGELMKRQVCSMHLILVSSHVVILYLFTYTDGAGIPSTNGLILPKAEVYDVEKGTYELAEHYGKKQVDHYSMSTVKLNPKRAFSLGRLTLRTLRRVGRHKCRRFKTKSMDII